MNFVDVVAVAGTRLTEDGYLVAEARCVRTGVQHYTGAEVGRPDMQTVAVYRGDDQVFASDSLQSFSHAPITNDHPADSVTAENWKDLSVGEVSTAAKRDGEWVTLPLILKDAAAIKSVEDGKRELSAGYSCELDWTPGTTADGQAFDAQQRSIKINHLALVGSARAGSEARIGDGATSWGASPVYSHTADERTKQMDLRKVMVDGLQVETTDQGAAAIERLQNDLKAANAKITDTDTAHQAALAAKDAEIAKKDAALDAEKAKVLSDADLDKKVQARAALVTVAQAIAKDIKTDGLSDADIRKAVVAAKLGDDAIADKAPAYIDARFDILAEDAVKGTDSFRDTVNSGLKSTDGDNAAVNDAYNKMVTDMQSAHRPATAN